MYTYENRQCLLTFFTKDDGDAKLTQTGRGGEVPQIVQHPRISWP